MPLFPNPLIRSCVTWSRTKAWKTKQAHVQENVQLTESPRFPQESVHTCSLHLFHTRKRVRNSTGPHGVDTSPNKRTYVTMTMWPFCEMPPNYLLV